MLKSASGFLSTECDQMPTYMTQIVKASKWHLCYSFCLRLIYHFQLSILYSRAPHNSILKWRLTRRSCAGRLPLFPDSDWLDDDEDPSMPPWPDWLIPLAELQGSVELFVPSDRKMTKYIEPNKCTGFCPQVNTSRRQGNNRKSSY